MPEGSSTSVVPRIQSLARADAILTEVAAAPTGALRLSELSQRLELNRTTVFNLAESLVMLGFLAKDESGYCLGLRNIELGRAATRRIDLLPILRPVLMRICHETGETVNLAMPYLTDAMIVESYESRHGVRATAYAGTRAPYHATACGKALLTRFSPEIRAQVYAFAGLPAVTARTITDRNKLEADLAGIERRGYALEVEESELGAFCVAMAIVNSFGEALVSISVASVTQRMSDETIAGFAAVLEKESRELERALRGQPAATMARQPRAANA
jgi:IclR family acetate operon transcriptional repressor